jgi:signal transduction histidine kinase
MLRLRMSRLVEAPPFHLSCLGAKVADMSGDIPSDSSESAVNQERERIAAALTDRVVRRLFEVGIGLIGLASAIDHPRHSDELRRHVDVLDAVIVDIRSTLFADLSEPNQRLPTGLQARILQVVDDHIAQSSGHVSTRFAGDLSTLIEDQLADDIVEIIRETLANRPQTDAHAVDIDIALVDGSVKVKISGQGLHTGTSADRVLAGIRERTRSQDVAVHYAATDGGAAQLTWHARPASSTAAAAPDARASEADDRDSAEDGLSSAG